MASRRHHEVALQLIQVIHHNFLHSSIPYLPACAFCLPCGRLTDLSSVLSDGEPVGAFGYGLAGRGGRRRISLSSMWRCHPQQRRLPGVLASRFRREPLGSLVSTNSRQRRSCDYHPVARHGLRQDDGVVEFPGPLVPLAAFFAKSRDPTCRGLHKRTVNTTAEKHAVLSSAAFSPSPVQCFQALAISCLICILFAIL